MTTEPEVLYWDVELTSSKGITPITNYIIRNGGAVTDTFNHDGSAIYLLRARMGMGLAGEVRKQQHVMSVERPPRVQVMTMRRIK
jgi:hypothetical protein